MTSLFQDIRVAMRSFSRSPGFAAIVAVTLAVGIGGTDILKQRGQGRNLSPIRLYITTSDISYH